MGQAHADETIMEIDMKVEVIKPIPDSLLHKLDDGALKELIEFYRVCLKYHIIGLKECNKFIDEVYKVLGYRCALEYVEKYGD